MGDVVGEGGGGGGWQGVYHNNYITVFLSMLYENDRVNVLDSISERRCQYKRAGIAKGGEGEEGGRQGRREGGRDCRIG